jgi:hypothetical protein
MRMIDRTPIRVGSRIVRIHSDTTLCSGIGRAVRRADVRRWHSFTCTYSAFISSEIYDVGFRVYVLGRRRYRCTSGRWLAGSP